MKCPGVGAGFSRADSLVLYLESAAWAATEAGVLACTAAAEARLRRGKPALAKSLGEGIAFAEDPGGGLSFGRSRCAMLAPALRPELPRDTLQEALTRALETAGVDPEYPWKNPT
jgi:hypothetical protein